MVRNLGSALNQWFIVWKRGVCDWLYDYAGSQEWVTMGCHNDKESHSHLCHWHSCIYSFWLVVCWLSNPVTNLCCSLGMWRWGEGRALAAAENRIVFLSSVMSVIIVESINQIENLYVGLALAHFNHLFLLSDPTLLDNILQMFC